MGGTGLHSSARRIKGSVAGMGPCWFDPAGAVQRNSAKKSLKRLRNRPGMRYDVLQRQESPGGLIDRPQFLRDEQSTNSLAWVPD